MSKQELKVAPELVFAEFQSYEFFKRLFDLILTLLFLIVFSPLFVLVAVLIWLETPGPVVVRERRIGFTPSWRVSDANGLARFSMYRFRTSVMPQAWAYRPANGARVTRLGRFLQRTSLDELPSLINVLLGDMSLVGPRPLPVSAVRTSLSEWHRQRFGVKPGVTGLWQVTRTNIGTLDEMALMDILYIENRSLALDLRILLLSIPLLVQRGTAEHWLPAYEGLDIDSSRAMYRIVKRVMDFTIALVSLIVFAPFLLLLALLIKLDSPGPVLFVQTRSGKRVIRNSSNGPFLEETSFNVYKFRTMYHDPDRNEALHRQWVSQWSSGQLKPKRPDDIVKVIDDRRVTRVGRFLRATSIDELPQLMNVLRGEMSMVGPRPVPLYEVEAYDDWHRRRLDAVPGITGLWQISLRGRGTLDEMVELDLDYIRHQSLLFDLKLLALTIPAVIVGRGAK